MSRVELSKVFSKHLAGADLVLEPGLHVLLGTPADGTGELVRLLAGLDRPHRGTVRVDGRDPYVDPQARQHIGCLLDAETQGDEQTVRQAVRRCLLARGLRHAPEEVLAPVGLEAWTDRAVADLDADEQRSVALAVALATPDPLLMALADPLARVPGASRAAIRDALHAAARAGAVVVCATPSIPSAVELGGGVVLLEAGRFTRRLAPSAATGLVPGLALELVVETREPRALAAALANEPAVSTLRFDIREARHVVRVRGDDVERVSLAVARAAVERSIVIEALHAEAPALELATAASGALQRAAYDAAYRAGAADAQRSTLPPRGESP